MGSPSSNRYCDNRGWVAALFMGLGVLPITALAGEGDAPWRDGIESTYRAAPWELETPYDATGPQRALLGIAAAASAGQQALAAQSAANQQYMERINALNRQKSPLMVQLEIDEQRRLEEEARKARVRAMYLSASHFIKPIQIKQVPMPMPGMSDKEYWQQIGFVMGNMASLYSDVRRSAGLESCSKCGEIGYVDAPPLPQTKVYKNPYKSSSSSSSSSR